jgi:arabinan endo-1,5-alpha-L-arabinosidase
MNHCPYFCRTLTLAPPGWIFPPSPVPYATFFSTSNCCDGPLTGYTVMVGRARTPMGPFLDKERHRSHQLRARRHLLSIDHGGQDYMLYHAVSTVTPYPSGFPSTAIRPALIDPIDWVNDWPVVRGGYGPSDTAQPAPAAQPWQYNAYQTHILPYDQPGKIIAALTDEFNSTTLSSQWHFIHPSADNTYVPTGSSYQVDTHGPDENGTPQQVSSLGEPTPSGDWKVETKITTNVPFDNSCCYNFARGALFIYGNDQNSIKLETFPNFDVRAAEFGRQVGPVPANYPTYDHQYIGQAAPTTWLRVAKHSNGARRLKVVVSSTPPTPAPMASTGSAAAPGSTRSAPARKSVSPLKMPPAPPSTSTTFASTR